MSAQRSGAMAWGSTSRAPALSHRSCHNHNHAIGQGRWSGAQLLEHRPDRTGLAIIIIIQSVKRTIQAYEFIRSSDSSIMGRSWAAAKRRGRQKAIAQVAQILFAQSDPDGLNATAACSFFAWLTVSNNDG